MMQHEYYCYDSFGNRKRVWEVWLSDQNKYLVQEGAIVAPTEDVNDGDWKTRIIHPIPDIPKDTEVMVIEVWTNFYGKWVRVEYNGRKYDIEPEKLKYIRLGAEH